MVRHAGSALDDGRVRAQALIASFKSQLPVRVLCELFDIPASTWYKRQQPAHKPDVKRLTERARVRELFYASEDSAGARTLAFQLAALGMTIGRYKVARLMKEAGLVSKQPGQQRYKQARNEHDLVPNKLNRQFDTQAPNQVWCGDIT